MSPGTLATMAPIGSAKLLGSPERLVMGQGRFVGDGFTSSLKYLAFVRAQEAQVRIRNIDCQAARQAVGVRAVLCAHDHASLAALRMPAPNLLLPLSIAVDFPLLAFELIDFVGQPVALVVADSPLLALEGAELVQIATEEPSAEPDANLQGIGTSLVTQMKVSAGAAVLSKEASLEVSTAIAMPRVIAMALEPRAVVALVSDEGLQVCVGSQAPSRAKQHLQGLMPGVPIEVLSPDVGGAFGSKASLTPDELLVAWAAWYLQTSLKWQASRSEEFLSGVQGRGSQLQGALSLDAEGRLLGLRAQGRFDLGAWLPYSAVVPTRNYARILPGPYQVTNLQVEAAGFLSAASAVNIYRGAGRPEAAMLMEVLVEQAARALQLDPVQLRMRNVVPAAAMPYTTLSGEAFDSGDFAALLKRCTQLGRYEQRRAELAQRRAQGECVGLGLGLYVEPCGVGWESARASLFADGRLLIASGSPGQGQGHANSFAKIARETLGALASRIDVIYGDTAQCPEGIGALASRSMAIGGSAVKAVCDLLVQALGRGERPGDAPLVFEHRYTAPAEAWSSGCVLAQIKIDRSTGQVTVEQIVWVDDCGAVVDADSVKGQLLGGLAQGLGQVFLERMVYDEHGQLRTGSLMDYAVPRADDMPPVLIETLSTPTQANLLGAKGVGEAGCIGPPAAMVNAVLDALAFEGVHLQDITLPLSSETIWSALQGAR